jgi:hypothetical protein
MSQLCAVILALTLILSSTCAPIFSDDSLQELKLSISKNDTQMIVISFPETTLTDVTLYIIAWDSLLYVQPYVISLKFNTFRYMRLYTWRSITDKFYFHSIDVNLTITNQSALSFVNSFINETQIRSTNKYGDLSICSPISDRKTLTDEPEYACYNLNTKIWRVVQANVWLTGEDILYLLLQLLATVGLLYYITYRLSLIRTHRSFPFVTDSMIHPPFWQCIIPGIPTKYLIKFQAWDSTLLFLLHIFLCSLTFLSAFSPDRWPIHNQVQLAVPLIESVTSRVGYLTVNSIVIVFNTILFVIKLTSENFHHRRFKIVVKRSVLFFIIKFIFAFIICATSMGLMVLDIMYLPTAHFAHRYYMWFVGAGLFNMGLLVHLLRKPVFIDRYFQKITQQQEKPNTTSEELLSSDERYYETEGRGGKAISTSNRSKFTTVMMIFGSWIVSAFWYASLIMITFHAGYVTSRFVRSTLTNMLINNEMIATYSYIASIIGVFYKFINDIEAPYLKLKNMVGKERGGWALERIAKTNIKIRNWTMEDVHKDQLMHRDTFFLLPMSWSIFIRVSKLMRLSRITGRILLQMTMTIFILCLFFFGASSQEFIFKIQDKLLMGVIVGTILPLIPRLISYFTENEVGMDSQIYSVRLINALRLLERNEENRTTEVFNWIIPTAYVPFRYTIVSIMKENDKEAFDPRTDEPQKMIDETTWQLKER